MARITQPEIDARVWCQVVAYDDQHDGTVHDGVRVTLAVDVLACGHRVVCARQPGGRKVVGHQEPCPTCTSTAIEDAEP